MPVPMGDPNQPHTHAPAWSLRTFRLSHRAGQTFRRHQPLAAAQAQHHGSTPEQGHISTYSHLFQPQETHIKHPS